MFCLEDVVETVSIDDSYWLRVGLVHAVPRYFRWTPHPVIVTTRENRDHIRVLLYSYYTTITGRGVLLRDTCYAGSSSLQSYTG